MGIVPSKFVNSYLISKLNPDDNTQLLCFSLLLKNTKHFLVYLNDINYVQEPNRNHFQTV